MLRAEAPVKRLQLPKYHATGSKTNSPRCVKKTSDNELPPITFLATKPRRKIEGEYFTFTFSDTKRLSCILSLEENITNSLESVITHPDKNKSMEEIAETQIVERSVSETALESDEEQHIVKSYTKNKLRIQSMDKSRYFRTLKVQQKACVDPNILKRKELLKGLKQVQTLAVRENTVKYSNNQKFQAFVKEIHDYCNINRFFTYEVKDTEIKLSSFGCVPQTFVVVFKEDANYSNWGFPKPLYVDGTEVCDNVLFETMKKQPSVETLLKELFRIACGVITGYMTM
ncbi:hypothetical protein EIN_117930 [Entamoeba invadens IP1]|uniref:Uncharacterized protein n=2 Tax=Entamoeba invadens TaxID=33085 RepID=L7FNG9_ENTIV|nr:hypothetical protein EIN_117930 [Entamoeba invadens IP1]ELP92219.1 hypothetical protein EIN_117930 [Entamoeba invadens IP1]BAN40460.1 hypothetical protein [Entamoeba invadens]|eukprot:XP_004258990.1 hypothetical protein EIN_117930 [Entamoeba invadens IP1]